MRILLTIVLLGLLGLLACKQATSNGSKTGKTGSSGSGGPALLAEDGPALPYPDAEIKFLQAALDKPTDGYPALANTWSVIASLPWPQPAASGSLQEQLTATVRKQYVEASAAGKPPPELLAAQLALLPGEGEAAIKSALDSQQWVQLQSLRFNAEVGHRLLRGADVQRMSPAAASICLNLLREWGSVDTADRPWLEVLSENEDPNVALRAAGWLLRLSLAPDAADKDSAEKWRKQLGTAVREKSSDIRVMAAAGEGIRISNDAKMADALVNLADKALSSVPGQIPEKEKSSGSPHGHMGTAGAFHDEGMGSDAASDSASSAGKSAEDQSAAANPNPHGSAGKGDAVKAADAGKGKDSDKDKGKDSGKPKVDPKSGQTSFEILYTMYALCFLPGEQASLLRQKLLEAKDPNVAWHARLGELLAGNPEPWNTALEQEGFSYQFWLALQTREAVSTELLSTYEKAATSEESSYRIDVARQLERFADLGPEGIGAEDNRLVALLQLLTKDSLDPVRQMAWFSAAELRPRELGPEARRIAESAGEPPVLRLAACYAVLNLLAHGTEVPAPAAPQADAAKEENKEEAAGSAAAPAGGEASGTASPSGEGA